MNNHFYFYRFLQYLIPALFVASLFVSSNTLKMSIIEKVNCKNGNIYSFRSFDLPAEGYTWLDCDFGLRIGNEEDYSKALISKFSTPLDKGFVESRDLASTNGENADEWEIVEIVPDIQSRVELIGLASEFKVIEQDLDIKRFGELIFPKLPIVAIIISAIAFLGALVVPTKKNIKQHGETSELVTAISFSLLISGVLVVAIVLGYKTWLSWLEPKISDFRLWRSTFFSQNIYLIKPLGLSIGILIASLVTVEFIENVKIKGFRQAWKDFWTENTRGKQEKKSELPPFKLSSFKETWSGKVIIGMTMTLIVMIIIGLVASLISQ